MKPIRLILCLLLFPLTIWYAVGVAIRNLYYSLHNIQNSNAVRANSGDSRSPVTIGIGNLRMGGTGKTPHTEYLVRLLQSPGFVSVPSVALLSRGYGRKTKGFLLADNSHQTSDTTHRTSDITHLLGDEPAMMARKFPDLTVAVCEDRQEGIRRLMQLPRPPRIVLLDDVYQHRRVKPTLNILLTEYGDPFFRDHILPFGNLREFRSGRRRADIVVVTKCPSHLSNSEREQFRRKLRLSPKQQLFFSSISYQPFQPLYGRGQWQSVDEILLVTGIANPTPLQRHLGQSAAVTLLRYPDHHRFSPGDCRKILDTFNALASPAKAVVTTEKDALRLLAPSIAGMLDKLPVFYIPVKVEFLEDDSFNQTIKKNL